MAVRLRNRTLGKSLSGLGFRALRAGMHASIAWMRVSLKLKPDKGFLASIFKVISLT